MAFINIRNNKIALLIARHRWLRRLNIFSLPDYGFVNWKSWFFYVYLKDWKGPSFHVLNSGVESYEEPNYHLIRYLCRGKSVFIDVGANIGIFSVRLARDESDSKVYAFEPEPHAFRCLEHTISANNLSAVRLSNCALSDSEGTAIFYFDGENHGGHSLDASAILRDGSIITQEIPVKVTTLDHVVESYSLDMVTLVKVDVQRHEVSVLNGALKMIRKFRPIFLVEIFFDDLLSPTVFEAFKAAGNYSVYDVFLQRFVSIETCAQEIRARDNELFRDLFLVPEEKKYLLISGKEHKLTNV